MRFRYPDERYQRSGRETLRRLRRSFILSLILPGLGQIASGRIVTGIFFMAVFFIPFYYVYLIGFSPDYGTLSLLAVELFAYAVQAFDAGRQPFRESSPCEDFCPAGVNIPSFMSLVERGDFVSAFGNFCTSNPLPFTLGEICPAPCEEKCGILPERSLRIREVHREFGRKFLEGFNVEKREPLFGDSGKRVAVIGSGPAGITVSYFLSSCGVQVDIFEREGEPGGLLNAIPDFKLDRDLVRKEIGFALSFRNVNLLLNREVRSLNELTGYDAVVVSVGAGKERKPDFPVSSDRLIFPLKFLKSPPPLEGRRVIVIGAGDTAFDVARLAVRMGARASVFYRRSFNEIRAQRGEVDSAMAEGVNVYTSYIPERVSGRRAVFTRDGRKVTVDFDFVVPALGFERDVDLLRRLGVDPKRKVQGRVFICGDAWNGLSTASEACGDARLTAYSVLKSLGLKDRAWFTVDFYIPKEENIKSPEGYEREASLCQHCGIRVKS